MKESELERILVEEVRKEGGKAYKWVSPGNDGVPDRIVIFPGGKIYFVELKVEGGRVSATQIAQLKALANLGLDAFVIRGIKGLIGFFRMVGKGRVADRLEKRYGMGGDD